MGFIAIIGAGALGGAVAQTLAARDRVREIRLIDPSGSIARGKALDIQQSAPVDNFCATLTAAESVESAVGADVIVIADTAAGAEHSGDAGLGLVRHLTRAGHRGPIVFAGAGQREVMGRAVTELHLERQEVLGSAPFALESALRALAGLLLDGSAVDVCLRVVGVPPRHVVVGWEEATAFGQPLSSQLPPHAIAGLAARIPGLWPPGPYALASGPPGSSRRSRSDRASDIHVSSWPTAGRSEPLSSPCQSNSDHRAWPASSNRH